MVRGTQYMLFRYTKFYHKMQVQEFVIDFLNSQGGAFKVSLTISFLGLDE